MHVSKIHKPRGQMSEAFLTAAFLSLSGGLQDACTYISRGRVFANAQTGNIVLLSQSICERDPSRTIHYLIPLLFFAFGVAGAELIRQCYQHSRRVHWRQLVLLIEMILLLIVGFLPDSQNVLANSMVSFACAMQVQSFRKVNGFSFASTMCIGNLRSGMESLCAYRIAKDRKTLYKAAHYFGIIFLFAFGAGLGGVCIPHFGMRTIWFSCALLLVSFLLMFLKEDLPEVKEDLREVREDVKEDLKEVREDLESKL